MSEPLVKRVARYLCRRVGDLSFSGVQDPRQRRGRRWELRSLLSATVIGMVAQEKHFRGIERLTRDLRGCRGKFGIQRRVPDSTLARLYARLDDEAGLRSNLVEAIHRAKRRKALEPIDLPIGVLAIDGKTIWTGHKEIDDPACQLSEQGKRKDYRIHTLHAVLVTAASQPCIDQMLVPGETNEMGQLPQFLDQLVESYGNESYFEVISVDAGMTSAHNADCISQHGLRYVMAVKDNQPALLAEIKRQCGSGDKKQAGLVRAAATPWENYRGKRVRRELFSSTDIAGWPAWESAKQAWRIRQTTVRANGSSVIEERYFISNLPMARLKPLQILHLARLHWGIENGCHWTMDVVLHEDNNVWCTKGRALRMLSWLRLMAYNLLRGLRDRYLRSMKHRSMPWDDLRRYLSQALTIARAWSKASGTEADLATR